jgi:hypothetical protein
MRNFSLAGLTVIALGTAMFGPELVGRAQSVGHFSMKELPHTAAPLRLSVARRVLPPFRR